MIDLKKLFEDFKINVDSLTYEELLEGQRQAELDTQGCRDWCAEKRVEIPFGEYKIVAEIDDSNQPEIPPEMIICICDTNNRIVQDVCLVRPHYDINRKTMEFETNNDFVDCLVWADSDNEDYTHKHIIKIYKEEE